MTTADNHPFVAGAILVAAWGHRAANIDFYRVTRVTSKTVVLRRVDARVVEIVEPTRAVVSPISDAFRSEEQRRRIRRDEGGWHVLLSSWERASLWDGQPRVSARFA